MRGRTLALGGCIVAALVTLAGVAVWAAPPNMTVTPSEHDFGILCQGTSATRSFSINNTPSDGDPLEIDSITRNGSDRFTPASVTPPPPIQGGRSASFSVTFTAPPHGTVSARYDVTKEPGDDPDTDTVSVRGTGVDRRIASDRSTVSFGEQRVGTRSPTQKLIVRNLGADSVTVTGARKVGANEADFRITAPSVPFTIGPNGGFVNITIAFQPAAAGLRRGVLELTSNACGKPKLSVSLVGTGVVPKIVVDPNPIDAGAVPIGTQGPPTPVTITNGGGVPLKITAVQVVGTDAADFTLSGLPTMPTTVAPNDSFVFNVRMTPEAEGIRVARINVLSDDPASPSHSVDLRGTGGEASPSPTASPSPSASASPTARSSPRATPAEPRALGPGSPNDSLAIGLVVAVVLLAFAGLIVVRRLISSPDDED